MATAPITTQHSAPSTQHFSSLGHAARPSPAGPPWLAELRRAATADFDRLGFPAQRQEAWRHSYSQLAPIAKTPFIPAAAASGEATLRQYTLVAEALAEIVFVNGRYAPRLSTLNRLPNGARVAPLTESFTLAAVQRSLGRYADATVNPFVALNTAAFGDGAMIHLARGTVLDRPIHVLFLSEPGAQPVVSYPRVLLVAEEHVRAAVIESYAGLGEGTYLTNAVSELVLGPEAQVEHCRLQHEGPAAYHVGATRVELGNAARFTSFCGAVGSKVTRHDLDVVLNGPGAEATLNGLVFIGGTQHVDNHTLLRHEKPNCPSHELYKHVLDDQASGVFKGKILVQPGAQKTDAKQTSKTLLVSDKAFMNSQPALEIYAADVKCTHGSTTGPLDDTLVFYLQSRGIGMDAARHLLTYAFAADVTRRIGVGCVRRRVEEFMAARHDLPRDIRISER